MRAFFFARFRQASPSLMPSMVSTNSFHRPGSSRQWAALSVFRDPGAQLIALLGISLLLGGGGVGSGLQNLAVQLFALLLLAANLPAVIDFTRSAPIGLRILTAVSIILPLVQLIPLPPYIWHALPGRELMVSSLKLVGASEEWRPITVNMMRTLVAFLGTIPPFTALILSWRARSRYPDRILLAVVVMALISMALAVVQLSSGNTIAMIQSEAIGGQDLFGTFANRNSSGLFFVIALICLLGLRQYKIGFFAIPGVWILATLVLTTGVVLSHSRSSLALLIVPASIGAVNFLRNARGNQQSLKTWSLALLLVVLIGFFGALGIAASGNQRLERTLLRFDDLHDARASIWEDSLDATRRYWPVGSGIGTFDEVFQVNESVETLDPLRAGRAHNDYLEVILESGAIGGFIVLSWLFWIARRSILVLFCRKWGAPLSAVLGLAVVAMQSVLDYPLRNLALMCIAAMFVGLLAAHNTSSDGSNAGAPRG
ncbi:O-antigen ligase family protein [Sphingomonas sp. HH69]